MHAAEAMRPALLLPELLLFLGGLVSLLGGSFLPRQRQWVARAAAALAVVASGAAAAVALAGPEQTAFEGTFSVDLATGVARLVVAVGTLLVLALASDEIAGSARESETCALLLFAAAGTLVVAGADDLLVLVAGFLLASVPLYGLIGIGRTARAAEAAMKTYLVGALSGILLMLGVTLLYGVSGTTMYSELGTGLAEAPAGPVALGVVGVLAGLMFKIGGVPAHFWVPDAAQGAGGAVAAFLTTVPKVGAAIALHRLLVALPATLDWAVLVGVLAVASMTLGNLAAFWQSDPRRLLGWSTVSQVGYVMVPVAAAGRSDLALPALLLYLAAYTVTNLAAFAVTTALPELRSLEDYRGLARLRPALGGTLVVALLGLVGTPPTAVFFGKLTVVTAAWDGALVWLGILVLVNTVVSLFYYLRWIAPLYAVVPDGRAATMGARPRPWSASTALVTAALSLAAGLGAGVLIAAFS